MTCQKCNSDTMPITNDAIFGLPISDSEASGRRILVRYGINLQVSHLSIFYLSKSNDIPRKSFVELG